MAKILEIKDKKAFTLIEVVTVLLIVAMGMIGVLSLIVQNIKSQSLNKNTLIAYQLAQEGVELIRQVRDSNWRQGQSWRTNLISGTYYMDYLDSAPQIITDPGQMRAYGNLGQDSDGMYRNNPLYAYYPQGNFSRVITLSDRGGGMLVVSTIYWRDHERSYSYSLEAMLYDWK